MSLISHYITIADQSINNSYTLRNPMELYNPIQYVLGLGGKRLRPALCLTACHIFSGDGAPALSAANGLEMFHNFTLLHDDIMDEAPIRRNQPTVHKKWNNNTAILSGDAMMILASELMLEVPSLVLKPIQKLFLQTALEVCEGQQYDMDFEMRDDVTVDEYLEMIRLKTAVLIAGSLKIGALIGGASQEDAQLMYEFGQNIGIAFQLQDDYLDVYGDTKEFGKNIGGDIVANKKTFLLINCIKQANREQLKELKDWMGKTDYDKDEKVEAIKRLYNEMKIADLSRKSMDIYYRQAINNTEKLTISEDYKKELKDFASTILLRTK